MKPCVPDRSRMRCGAGAALALLLAAGLVGCAGTNVDMSSQYQGSLPRPQRILIFPFATSPEDVQLD